MAEKAVEGGEVPDFAMELSVFAAHLETDFANGLTQEEVTRRIAKYGLNVLTPPPKKSKLLAFFQKQVEGFSGILWIGAVATFIIYLMDRRRSDLILTCALVVLVFGTGCFAWWQEMKADAVAASFANMAPQISSVLRDGKVSSVPASELVPGDVVILTGGLKIPADIRTVEVKGLKVDNSPLTGEPEPLPRSAECTRPDDRLETRNICFLGTSATEGWAKGVVMATGDNTFMGDIASKASGNVKPMSLMQIELINFVHIIMYIAFSTGIIFFIIAVVTGESVKESIVSTIGIIVATVPEGLLATVTVALVITAKNMEAKNVFVKRLDAIETLGAVTAICSDKTGTLTMNRMKVRHVVYHSGIELLKTLAPTPGDEASGSNKGAADHPLRIPDQDALLAKANKAVTQFLKTQPEAPPAIVTSEASADEMVVFARDSAVKIHDHLSRQFSNSLNPTVQAKARKDGNIETGYAADVVMADLVRSHMQTGSRGSEGQQINMDAVGRVSSTGLNVPGHARNASLARLKSTDLSRPVIQSVQPGNPLSLPYELALLVRCASLCNHAEFLSKDEAISLRPTSGDASETALLRFAEEHIDVDTLRKANPEVACLPFSSKHKFMATVHKLPPPLAIPDLVPGAETRQNRPKFVVCLKGAFERVINRCTTTVNGLPFDVEQGKIVSQFATELAGNGERILGLAQIELDPEQYPENYKFDVDDNGVPNFPVEGLSFIGLSSLEDPPRPEVPGAVSRCDSAGIQVVMVTGDHPLTARSIATQIGIIHADTTDVVLFNDMDKKGIKTRSELPNCKALVVTGSDITEMEAMEVEFNNGEPLPVTRAARVDQRKRMKEDGTMDADTKSDDIYTKIPTKHFWDWIVSRKQLVFARTLPQQKQRIVQEFQRRGHVIAATGDGVNDAPALRAADIGVAMGIAGTEVAKEAADLVLLDDDFASIVKGIEEGRLIFDNLKKSIVYTLEKNMASLIPFLANVILGIPLALTPVMILCIDLGTDMLPAIAFAYESPEANIMDRPPADRTVDRLVTRPLICFAYFIIGIFEAIVGYVAFFMVLADYGFSTSWCFSSRLGTFWSDTDEAVDNIGKCYQFKNKSGQYECADYKYRANALDEAQTAMFTTIVLCQIAGGVAMKTRFTSVFTHGFKNTLLNIGYLTEFLLCIIFNYCPGFEVLDFVPGGIRAQYWFFPAIPAMLIIIFGDELRKWYCKKNPNNLFSKMFFY